MVRRPAALALCFTVAACGAFVDEGAERAYQLTLPAGASGTGVSVSRESARTTATWRIRSGQSWDDYAEWVKGQLMKDFGSAAHTEGKRLLFRKLLDGDVHTLEVEPGSDQQGPYIAVTFTARPF